MASGTGLPRIAVAFVIGWIYCLSGICSLIDQVIWVRLLKLTIGNTVYATGVVVSVFMGGLALGSLLMARYADRVRRPLRLYAFLELGITIAALALPFLLQLADHLYIGAYRAWKPSPGQLLLMQVLISSLLLLIPTILMGSTLPLLGRWVSGLGGAIGFRVGRLYAINTLGAALGAFLSGFVLIRTVGVLGTFFIAAGLNLAVAFGAFLLSRNETEEPITSETKDEEDTPTRESAEDRGRVRRVALAFGLFVSGFVGIGYEIVWMRSIVHVLGADTYVFSSVLTIYLLGYVVGTAAGTWLCERWKSSGVAFAGSLFLLGLFGIVYVPVFAFLSDNLLPHTDPHLYRAYIENPGFWSSVYPLLHSALFFTVPCILMGVGFPLALQAWHHSDRGAGRSTGTAYGANTIGAVLAGLLTSFALIPLCGVQAAITLVGLLGVLAALAVAWTCLPAPRLRWSCALPLAVLAAVVAVAIPSDLFRRRLVKYMDTELLAVREGVTTTVSVHRTKKGARWLCTSGLQVAGDEAKTVQRMLGHLGVLLHGRAESVLTVGFGTGETTACLARHEPKPRIDCVEISPELVAQSLESFTHINLGDRLHQEVNMIFMDAKNYLRMTDRTYDVIHSDSINPKYFAENASLYTREYFASAKEHLNPKGIVVCWIPLTLPITCFDSILGTFMEIFPHTTLWAPTTRWDHFILLVGSVEPQRYAPVRIRKILEAKGVKENLAGIHVRNDFDLFGCYLGDEKKLNAYLKAYKANTDFEPFVEFSTDPFLDETEKWRFMMDLIKRTRAKDIAEHIDWEGFSGTEKEQWLKDQDRYYDITSQFISISSPLREGKGMPAGFHVSKEADALIANLDDLLARHHEFLRGYFVRGCLLSARRRFDRALADFSHILKLDQDDTLAWNNRGHTYLQKGLLDKAIADFDRALDRRPKYYEALNNRGNAHLGRGEVDKAIADFDRAVASAPDSPTGWNNRGVAYGHKQSFDQAIADFDRALRIAPEYLDAYLNRASVHFMQERYTEALKDFNRALKLNPSFGQAYQDRAWTYYHLRKYDKARKDLEKCKTLGHLPDQDLIDALNQAQDSR